MPKSSDWVERANPKSKLPNFDSGRILEPESQALKSMLGLPDVPSSTEHITESEAESQAPLPPLKPLQGAAPSSKLTPLQFNPHSPK